MVNHSQQLGTSPSITIIYWPAPAMQNHTFWAILKKELRSGGGGLDRLAFSFIQI